MSHLKISCPSHLYLTLWFVEHTSKEDADNIPIHSSASSTYVSSRLYVLTIFPSAWLILYMIEFSWGLPGAYDLVLIPYYYSIKLFLNLWQIHYTPRSYVIPTGQVYLTRYVVSSRFVILVTFLSLYFFISNHPVMDSTIVMYFNINISFPVHIIL